MMRLAVMSARLHECGASIAALRSTANLAPAFDKVNYYFEEGSYETEVKQIFPSVNIISANAKKHIGRRPVEIYRREFDKFKPDFVVVHNFDHDFETLSDIADDYPLLWMMHDASPVSGLHYAMKSIDGRQVVRYPSRKGVPGRSFFERAARQRFGFAAPSEWLLKIGRHYVCDGTPISLVRNSVPSGMYSPRDKAVARALLGVRDDAFAILFFAGRGAMERKNLTILVDALRYIPDPKLQVAVIGGLPQGTRVDDPRLTFLPNFSQQRDPVKPSLIYSAADLFLLPSLVDNLPNTVLESYFCGTPVLASRTGGAREMMIENETGWLFDPRSAVDLAEKISMLMRSKTLAAAGLKGRAFVSEHFSEEKSRSQYLAALDQVAGLPAARAAPALPTVTHPTKPAKPVYAPGPEPLSFNDSASIHRGLNPDSHIAVYRDKWNPSLSEKKWLGLCYRMGASGHPLRENERRIAKWRNCYEGKRAFLIGNGPSLNECDLSFLKNEITIGVNSIFLKKDELGGLPTHYVVEDFFVAEDRAEQINNLTGTNKWFGNYLQYCLEGPDVHWLNVRMRYDDYPHFPYFSTDAVRQMWVGGSVTFVCMQLAFFFGVKELYLIGFDHHYVVPETTSIDGMNFTSLGDDPNHFDKTYFGKGLRWHDPKTDRMEQGYAKAGRVFEMYGRKIFNATVGGRLEVFDRVDYKTLFGPGGSPSRAARQPQRAAAE